MNILEYNKKWTHKHDKHETCQKHDHRVINCTVKIAFVKQTLSILSSKWLATHTGRLTVSMGFKTSILTFLLFHSTHLFRNGAKATASGRSDSQSGIGEKVVNFKWTRFGNDFLSASLFSHKTKFWLFWGAKKTPIIIYQEEINKLCLQSQLDNLWKRYYFLAP